METPEEAELCFPQLLNASCRKPLQQKHAGSVLVFMVVCFLSLLTVTLNLLVIISVSHFRQLRTPTNLLLLSLAVSDFLVGLFVMPVRILLIEECWILGTFMCGLYFYICFILTSASVGNMVLISADRYVAICNPMRYPTRVTVSRVQLCVCLCWAASVLYNGVILAPFLKDPGMYILCIGECVIFIKYISSVVDLIVTFFGPVCSIVFLYMRVFLVAVSQARAMRSHVVSLQGSGRASANKSERKAALALGTVVLAFLVCLFPFFYPSLTGSAMKSNKLFEVFSVWLFYTNSCVNPLLYAFFYPWFRKSVKSVVTLKILQPDSSHAHVL